MEIILQFGLLVLGFVMLIKGADWFVDGAAGIASKLGIPQLIIGLTIVAMGTSAPEAAVSISSAMKGSADITIGNVVGSNIMNVLVILGLTASIVTIKVAKSTVRIEIPFMIGISVLLLALGMTGNVITFVEGVVLWIAFIAYLVYLFVMAKKGKEKSEEETGNDGKKKPLWLLAVLIVVGAAMIVLGSNFAVDGASAIATAFGLSERFIGLTIVALGTSLPELVTSVTAAKKGNADIAIGNIVGSNIFNILFVVGTTALITPVAFASNFLIDSLVAIGAAVLLWIGCFRKNQLGRCVGILMLVAYAAYFVYLI
ncbi:MAG: calcium/sodium antiporter [Acetatifactor sp.]